MLNIYVDESIHEAARYIVVAFVVAPVDPQAHVDRLLVRLGYRPGIDEFKSSHRMESDRRRRILREALGSVVQRCCSLAFLITDAKARPVLGAHILNALEQLIGPRPVPDDGIRVVVDDGIPIPSKLPEHLAGLMSAGQLVIAPNSDSRQIGGLQLADLAAHRCALMLLGELGRNTKLVKAGPRSGYDPDTEFPLGWTMWAELRWLLLHGGHPTLEEIDASGGHYVTVEGYGLFFGEGCPPEVVDAARATIGRCYLGCIH